MVVTEGKYIYFRKFMLKKRDVYIAAAAFLVLLILVAIVVVKILPTAEEREIKAIHEGKMRILGGQIMEVFVDQNNFVIDTDPYGMHKSYTIYFNKNTEFIILTQSKKETPAPKIVGGFPVFEGGSPPKPDALEQKSGSISDLKSGMQAQVEFRDRLDVEGEEKLTAKSVKVFDIQ